MAEDSDAEKNEPASQKRLEQAREEGDVPRSREVATFTVLMAAGAGAKSRFDIGVVIAAGMTIGTLFTLFITPAIYSYIARDRRHMHDLENASDVLAPVVSTPANDLGVAVARAAE